MQRSLLNSMDFDDDWHVPHPSALPQTSDRPAVPPGGVSGIETPPHIPQGSAYSRRRNQWRAPDGSTFDAGNFRPLPPDRNTIDSQGFLGEALYGRQRVEGI